MRWIRRIRSLPVRAKIFLTVLGAAVAALGASTSLSFRYWESEALAAAERQALLVAASAQGSLETAIRLGRLALAHHALTRLREDGDVTLARVYGPDGEILISADAFEEGTRPAGIFIPSAAELPRGGVVKPPTLEGAIRAYLPVSIPDPAVLEVEFSVAPTLAAMDRGARLGIGLMAVSFLVVGVIVLTMFEREVVRPLHRMDVLLRTEADPAGRPQARGDEIDQLERSVSELIQKERAVLARAEDQDRRLAAQEGLAQVGELAAEMAHEFKRPLASLRTAVSVLQQEYVLEGRGQAVLQSLEGQLDYLNETMGDLFSLARPVVVEATPVEICGISDDALAELAGHPSAEGVQVTRRYEDPSLLVRGDARRVRQALLNVMVNAAEAMPKGGRLTVAVGRGPAGFAEITVTDTGAGLDPDEVARAVKPFYSTKPQGTGLGLPLVARIVSAHRGGLSIESSPGSGTTVRITLPEAPALAGKGA